MEGKGLKSFIVVVLFLGLALEQIAAGSEGCCPSTPARNIYNTCRLTGGSKSMCANLSGCRLAGQNCAGYPYLTHSNSGEANALEFCKLGCASSVCSNIKSVVVGNEAANDVQLDRCGELCYRFCTKHVDTAATTVVS